MAKESYQGPLEQVDACCWRIPKSYKPGGVGYDINCGVRLVRSNLFYRDVKPHLLELVEELFRNVPTGVGRSGRFKYDRKELGRLLGEGPRFLLNRGLATPGDIDHTE